MHIPDGFVSAPINIAAAAASIGVVGYALKRAGNSVDQKKIPLLGVVAAFVFAAQMLNFPVVAGTSGHFVGAVLAAVLLGPFEAVLVMASVLVLQCLMFADGGITALGSNIFNMGIVGALLGYLVFKGLRAILPKNKRGMFASAAIAAWLSIVASAASCAVMLAASGRYPLELALPAMTGVHALIGVGEGAITAAALALVTAARPDLVHALRRSGGNGAEKPAVAGAWGFAAVGLGAAIVLAAVLSPFASGDPDGLEKKAMEESSRQVAEAAKAELVRPGIARVAISANPGVAEILENEKSASRAVLASAGADALGKIRIGKSDEMEIFAWRITATDSNGAERVKENEQEGRVWTHSPIPDYEIGAGKSNFAKVALAGIIGTLLAFGVAFAVLNAVRGRKH
jgi:cobalt/nickel transport system permease protein